MASLTANRMANNSLTGRSTQLETQPTRSPPQRGQFPVGTLRLRAESAPRRGIRWAEDVVDNEGLGRKSSKVCCIYHKPHPVGESSSEDDSGSSSSDSDSDSGADNSTAHRAGAKKDRDHSAHKHGHGDGCQHEHGDRQKARAARRETRKKKSPNAYEKLSKSGSTKTVTH